MDADTLVVFGASEVVRGCAGKAAITSDITGLGALMRIPVVTGVFVNEIYLIVNNYLTVQGSFKITNIFTPFTDLPKSYQRAD